VQGLQTVDLSWTGATSNSIDVYRNGVLFVTVPNKSFYTYHPDGRGHATCIYKVCEAGTGKCPNRCYRAHWNSPAPDMGGLNLLSINSSRIKPSAPTNVWFH